MDYIEEIPKYRKKSNAKSPKKAKHKHIYEPCVLEYNGCRISKEHGVTYDNPEAHIGAYCPICGKLGEVSDKERWYGMRPIFHPIYHTVFEPYKTEECERELNPYTRTLPTFWCNDGVFQKYVEINEET